MWAFIVARWLVDAGVFATGAIIGVYAVVMMMIFGSRRSHPFTRLGRARMRWYRERDARAAMYMRAGLHPAQAIEKATDELTHEGREALGE